MNLTLSKRLMLMLVGALVAIIVVGGVGLSTMERINAQLETVQLRYMPAVEALDRFALAFSNVRRASAIYSNAPNERARASAKKVYVDSIDDMKQRLVEFRGKTVGVPDEAPLVTGEEEASQRYLQRAGLLMEQLEAPGADIAALLEEAPKALGAIGAELLKHLDAHREVYNRLTAEGEAQAQRLHESARYWIWGSAIVALLVLGAMGGLLIREIRARLEDLSSHMTSISRNQDFTQRIRVTRMDELGLTAEAFNSLVERMQGNLRSITENARSVAEASSVLAESSSQVAVAAGHQSEAAASVAATVEEITVSINHVGEQAQEADRLSAHSEKLAVEGEEVILRTAGDIQDIAQTVHDAAALIAQLEQSSQKVAGVMQVIKDVADQTNLLALNAAIEAARAGEQGRGFAVVADEVRKLAERTATSTQEITATVGTMIANAENATSQMNVVVEKVNSGVSSAQQTSESIQGIGQGCRAAVGTVAEIASAIREQGAATTNIAIQIEKIAQMSEQSSAAASESSHGAHRVDELARTMLGVVSAYRLS